MSSLIVVSVLMFIFVAISVFIESTVFRLSVTLRHKEDKTPQLHELTPADPLSLRKRVIAESIDKDHACLSLRPWDCGKDEIVCPYCDNIIEIEREATCSYCGIEWCIGGTALIPTKGTLIYNRDNENI